MEIAQLVLEYIKAILNSSVVLALVGACVVLQFKVSISGLLNRIAWFKVGSTHFSASQPPPEEGEGEKLPLPPSSTTTPTDTSTDATECQKALQAEQLQARIWEFRYLNHYLVANTQHVLDWLARQDSPVTHSAYDTVWQPRIPSAQERTAIFQALESHRLIELKKGLILVTQKGHEYIQYRGLVSAPNMPPTV